MKGCENLNKMVSMAGVGKLSSCCILNDLKVGERYLIKAGEKGVTVIYMD